MGASIAGNTHCASSDWTKECCFCKPNGVRTTQVGIWVPETRNEGGTRGLTVKNVVSRSTQADGINLHGKVKDTVVEMAHFSNTGDDVFVVWGGRDNPANTTFRNTTAVNPGLLRPGWYGNCYATYGLESATFERTACHAPILQHPIPQPGTTNTTRIDNSMFVIYTSFGGTYPKNNLLTIRDGWTFTDLDGNPYTLKNASMGEPSPGKMVWSVAEGGVTAPFYLPQKTQTVNVAVVGEGRRAEG